MPRQRSPAREKAKQMYLNSKGEMKLKDISAELGVLDTQIRKWKSTDKWEEELKVTLPKKKRNVTNKKDTEKVEPNQETKEDNKTSIEVYELTERQRLFAEAFVKIPIAYKAAIKAGYSQNCAFAESSRLLTNVKVRTYINYLKELKRQSIMLDIEDIVDKQMRIAFSDITDFAEFGQERVPIMSKGSPIVGKNPITGEKEIMTQKVNTMRLKESYEVDGELITEIKANVQGVSIKLEDRQKAMEWLTNFFEMNPMNKHKRDYDNAKLELEKQKFELEKSKVTGDTEESEDDGFIEALSGTAQEDWSDEEV